MSAIPRRVTSRFTQCMGYEGERRCRRAPCPLAPGRGLCWKHIPEHVDDLVEAHKVRANS